MKKSLIIYTIVAAVSFGFMGCSQDEMVVDGISVNKQAITFASGNETTPTTRTSMGGAYTDDTFPFYWETGDAIWVNGTDHIKGDNTNTAAKALFKGTVTTSAPYLIRYTGTGSYNTKNSRLGVTVNTTSNASTLVIPPVQKIAESDLGSTKMFGKIGDCGTATATGSGSSYKFKLDHQAAYLILMPHWGTGGTNTTYNLKSVTVTDNNNDNPLSGRFDFSDSGIGNAVTNTHGSSAIKVNIGGSDGIVLATATDQSKSINVVIKPLTTVTNLYCIYEVYDTQTKNTYYFEKIISGKSYAANSVTPIAADLQKSYDMARLGKDADGNAVSGGAYLDLITNKNPYSGFYQWDAPEGEEYFVSFDMLGDYSTITSGVASNTGCAACPTRKDITKYLKGGCYWDANKVWGPGANQHGGMWFKNKNKLISLGIYNDDNAWATFATPVQTAPNDFITSEWFFLPAAGYCENGRLNNVGKEGVYWSSTPHLANTYNLYFKSDGARVDWQIYETRSQGNCLWTEQ